MNTLILYKHILKPSNNLHEYTIRQMEYDWTPLEFIKLDSIINNHLRVSLQYRFNWSTNTIVDTSLFNMYTIVYFYIIFCVFVFVFIIFISICFYSIESKIIELAAPYSERILFVVAVAFERQLSFAV